nr:carboxylesterase 1-like [Ipomoea batatas]
MACESGDGGNDDAHFESILWSKRLEEESTATCMLRFENISRGVRSHPGRGKRKSTTGYIDHTEEVAGRMDQNGGSAGFKSETHRISRGARPSRIREQRESEEHSGENSCKQRESEESWYNNCRKGGRSKLPISLLRIIVAMDPKDVKIYGMLGFEYNPDGSITRQRELPSTF